MKEQDGDGGARRILRSKANVKARDEYAEQEGDGGERRRLRSKTKVKKQGEDEGLGRI